MWQSQSLVSIILIPSPPTHAHARAHTHSNIHLVKFLQVYRPNIWIFTFRFLYEVIYSVVVPHFGSCYRTFKKFRRQNLVSCSSAKYSGPNLVHCHKLTHDGIGDFLIQLKEATTVSLSRHTFLIIPRMKLTAFYPNITKQ